MYDDEFDKLIEEFLYGELSYIDLVVLLDTILKDRKKYDRCYMAASVSRFVYSSKWQTLLEVSRN